MLEKVKKFFLPEIEEKILNFWQRNQIFQKVLNKNKGKRKFVFYEGPPTANGEPGIHHILARSFKDIILRFKTMEGFNVSRRSGWDTHGLPVELEIEKKLGFQSKKEIEKFGIASFNELCRQSVWNYKKEWEKMTKRIGFWLDLEHPYITYTNRYIESLWWIIKQFFKKGLLFEDYKIAPYCYRCGTTLSSHELALGYERISENSFYLKFKIFKTKNRYLISWTTTPWTLPANVALAVNPNFVYVEIKIQNEKKETEYWILAQSRLSVIEGPYQIVKKFKGKKLIGLKYEPLFKIKALFSSKSFRVYPADFVTMSEGTGIVHLAPLYGEDDYKMGKKFGLPLRHLVSENGLFNSLVKGFKNLAVKDLKTEEKISQYLKKNNSLLKIVAYEHDYPFCWRCHSPLLYYARKSFFVKMSKLKNALMRNNQKINWVPPSVKTGRFGAWLQEVKDWNFSRERFWGTPLPLWRCEKCGSFQVIESREELSSFLKESSNHYFILRHGESVNNISNLINCLKEDKDLYPLTLKGRLAIEKLAQKLEKEKIDLIFSSDFLRTKETAQIISRRLNLKIHFDPRLREINVGIFNGQKAKSYEEFFDSPALKFYKNPPQGENLKQLAQRVFNFIIDIEKKYKNKNILIISHEYPLWMLEAVSSGWDEEEALFQKEKRGKNFIQLAELREIKFKNLARNEFGFGDLHRPYIDKIVFSCQKCGGKMKRVPELADVWFDSGSMPFAQMHFPFDQINQNQKLNIKSLLKKIDFPADFISEGIDQTRGWFYTLLATSTALGFGAPYKNVIVLGLVVDKNGQKMSKSKGNIVKPLEMINKYGADVIRFYFFSLNPPLETKKFDENGLMKILKEFVLPLYHCFVFYKTYAFKDKKFVLPKIKNVLDIWILLKLDNLIKETTKSLNQYDVYSASRRIKDFIDDLSRWYLRRSRQRFSLAFKEKNSWSEKDYKAASFTLGYVLLTLSKLLAPFMPFFSEALFQSLQPHLNSSVHLEDWPKRFPFLKLKINRSFSLKILKTMEEVRYLASLALAQRAALGLKIRQPIASLKIKNQKSKIKNNKEFLKILKDEINVKEILFDPQIKNAIELDTKITAELKAEGYLRELIRLIQDLRKKAGYWPKDRIYLWLEGPKEIELVVNKYFSNFKEKIGAKNVEFKHSDKFDAEWETKIESFNIWLGIKKV